MSQEIIGELSREKNEFSVILNVTPTNTRFFQRGWYHPEQRKVSVYAMERTMVPIKTTHGQDITPKDIKGEKIGELSPLSYVLIYKTDSGVSLIEEALSTAGSSSLYYAVPAIFLDYYQRKELLDTLEKGVAVTLDIATIAISGGTALATKVHWIPRAWALAEVVGAVGNITANTIKEINGDNKELREIVDIYNIAMGAIGIKNLGQVGYKFAKNLPQTTKNILQKNGNLRTQLVKSYQDWKRRIGQLKTSKKFEKLADNEKKLLEGQEEGWKLLGFEDKIDDIILNAKWVDDLETVIGINVKNKIKEWVKKGLDYSKLESSFNKSSNKLELFSRLEKAKSLNHQKVIIGDYENILGVTKGKYISNSVDNIKSDIKIKVNNNDFILKKYQGETFAKNAKLIKRENIEVIEDLGNGIQFIKIKPGTKLYRVFDGYKPWDDISQTGSTLPKGNYWTFDKPTSISEVIGGTAVMPEWNGKNY
ncbi:hypothetical protein [Capnocytophaga sp. G2]|uniref:hypothetical protein n=1 Tax=Capnocytophaga sp. G2 TaxID=3110695 RepID=UPI002B463E5A|nr:hypothetical protein [Capnocytophaga sp. G2]MEB3005907.1 hypothetical protein [Capnocytophaga sp. G2]